MYCEAEPIELEIRSAHTTVINCFKAYEESTTYLKGEHAVRFAYLYHYATLTYRGDSKIPTPSIDGNYYDIGQPIRSVCGDIWSASTDVLIGDGRLKARVEAVLERCASLEVEQFLLENGFIPVDMAMMHGKGVMINAEGVPRMTAVGRKQTLKNTFLT